MQMLISRNPKRLLEKHRKRLIPKVFTLLWYAANRLSSSDSQNFISPRSEMSPSFKLVAASHSAPLCNGSLGFGFGLLMHKDFLPLGGTPQQASASLCIPKAQALCFLKALLLPSPQPLCPNVQPCFTTT